MDVTMPDGTIITDVPDGTTKAQLTAKYQAHVGSSAPQSPAIDPNQNTWLDQALAPKEGTTYGSVLPIARDQDGPIRFALPSMARGVLQSLSHGLDATRTGDLSPEDSMTIAGVVTPFAPSSGAAKIINSQGIFGSDVPPPSSAQKAAAYVKHLMDSSGKTVEDLADTPGNKPSTVAESIGKQGQTGLMALGRREGTTGDELTGLLTERSRLMPSRVEDDLANASGVDPSMVRGDIKTFVADGRTAAKPLYEKAFEGGSIAPLKTQLQDQFADASSTFSKAVDEQRSADQDLTIAKSKQAATNDVYAQSSALQAERDANARLQSASTAVENAASTKDAILDRLRTAQSDEASGVRGGVWSPRIQQFIDDPLVKKGITRGLEIQRLEALAEGKPFNPTEYAVKGTDANGDAIVGRVPNMRLLDAAKRGLDAILEDSRDSTTGRLVLDQRGNAINAVRKSLVTELDRLNPDYAAARAAGGDYLSADEAFQNGARLLSDVKATPGDIIDRMSQMTKPQADAYKGGLVNNIHRLAQTGRLNLKVFLTPDAQAKLDAVLGRDQARYFVQQIGREIDLAKSGGRMMPNTNSTTGEMQEAVRAQDGAPGQIGEDAINFATHVAKGGSATGGLLNYGVGKAANYAQALLAGQRGMDIPTRDLAGKALMLDPRKLGDYLQELQSKVSPTPPQLQILRKQQSRAALARALIASPTQRDNQ